MAVEGAHEVAMNMDNTHEIAVAHIIQVFSVLLMSLSTMILTL
jgi:hypothetical protein